VDRSDGCSVGGRRLRPAWALRVVGTAAVVLMAGLAVATGTVAPVGATTSVALVSHSSYVTSSGYLHIVGEIVDQGTTNVEFIEVDFNLYDASGQLLDTNFTYASSDLLAAGERSPFHEIVTPPAGYDHYAITAISADATPARPNRNFAARVTNRFVDSIGVEHLVGEITNDNATRAEFVEAIFTFYDVGGATVDEGFTYVDTSDASLAPGQTALFEAIRSPSAPPYSTYGLLVDTSTELPPPPPTRQGYWMIGRDGAVYPFGAAVVYTHAKPPAGTYVDLEPTPSGNGYWTVDTLGHVYAYGDAHTYGGPPALAAGEAVTSLSGTVDGGGYWLFTNLGRVTTYGTAQHVGDMAGTKLNGPVLDSIPTPSGHGYYMVASDGGIFTFGDAVFRGSMGAVKLNAPVQSLVPDTDEAGYWLVASDGGIFAFDADFFGSMGSTKLNKPVTGMVGFGDGYLMSARTAASSPSATPRSSALGASPPRQPVVSVAILDQ
jgi:hypothetical protein